MAQRKRIYHSEKDKMLRSHFPVSPTTANRAIVVSWLE